MEISAPRLIPTPWRSPRPQLTPQYTLFFPQFSPIFPFSHPDPQVPKTKKPPGNLTFPGFPMVEVAGFEPTTSWSRNTFSVFTFNYIIFYLFTMYSLLALACFCYVYSVIIALFSPWVSPISFPFPTCLIQKHRYICYFFCNSCNTVILLL